MIKIFDDFSDEAFDTYKFFQIGLASILLVTLPIMIGCLKFNLWISRENKKKFQQTAQKGLSFNLCKKKIEPKEPESGERMEWMSKFVADFALAFVEADASRRNSLE